MLSAGPPQPAPPEVVSILGGTLEVDPIDLPERLRALPVERILELQQGIGFTAGGCVDGTVVTQFPVEAIRALGSRGVPIIAGTTRDEGTLLTSMMSGMRPAVLRLIAEGLAAGTFEGGDPSTYLTALGVALGDDPTEIHTAVWTDHFRRTAIRVAEAACEAGPGGWLYRFDVEPTGSLAGELGVTHAADLGFVFDTMEPVDDPALYDARLAEVREVASRWSTVLATFARDGRPDGAMPGWNPYLPARSCLIVDQLDVLETDIDSERQTMWGDRQD